MIVANNASIAQSSTNSTYYSRKIILLNMSNSEDAPKAYISSKDMYSIFKYRESLMYDMDTDASIKFQSESMPKQNQIKDSDIKHGPINHTEFNKWNDKIIALWNEKVIKTAESKVKSK